MSTDRLRWTDPDGAAWPLTGHLCAVCGLPLDPVLVECGYKDHGEESCMTPNAPEPDRLSTAAVWWPDGLDHDGELEALARLAARALTRLHRDELDAHSEPPADAPPEKGTTP
jgi:hypothetical protein